MEDLCLDSFFVENMVLFFQRRSRKNGDRRNFSWFSNGDIRADSVNRKSLDFLRIFENCALNVYLDGSLFIDPTAGAAPVNADRPHMAGWKIGGFRRPVGRRKRLPHLCTFVHCLKACLFAVEPEYLFLR